MHVYKNTSGVYLLKAIFYELDQSPEKEYATYTLKDEDHRVGDVLYKSLRRLFLETMDPTGYTLATEHLGGYPHLKRLLNCGWFVEYWEDWQEEMEAKLIANGLVSIQQKAGDPKSKDNLTASKYLMEQGWKKKADKVGRPSKEKILKEANDIFRKKSELEEDYERVILN